MKIKSIKVWKGKKKREWWVRWLKEDCIATEKCPSGREK